MIPVIVKQCISYISYVLLFEPETKSIQEQGPQAIQIIIEGLALSLAI